MFKKIFVFLSVGLFTGCVNFVKFDDTKPIQVVDHALGTSYRQEGKDVDIMSLWDGLEKNPKSKDEVENIRPLFYSSMGLAGIGGFLIGYNSVSGNSSGLLSGVVLAGAGIGLGAYIDRKTKTAVEEYNGGKKTWFPLIDFDPLKQQGLIGLQGHF